MHKVVDGMPLIHLLRFVQHQDFEAANPTNALQERLQTHELLKFKPFPLLPTLDSCMDIQEHRLLVKIRCSAARTPPYLSTLRQEALSAGPIPPPTRPSHEGKLTEVQYEAMETMVLAWDK